MDMSAAGDEDRWILLRRVSDADMPMIVRTRMNPEVHAFSQSNHVSAVICDVQPALVDEYGMPKCMEALYAFEDRLVGFMEGRLNRVYHTASATGDGRRTIYLAHRAGADIANLASSVQIEVADVWVTDDFTFEAYHGFTAPTPLDVQTESDERVISALEGHGDDGFTPRKIEFWFYGKRSALEVMAAQLANLGLAIEHWLDGDQEGVVMSTIAPATHEHFSMLTPALVYAAQSAGVEYDGWGTDVIAQSANVTAPSGPGSMNGL
jgi:hypothetical protein